LVNLWLKKFGQGSAGGSRADLNNEIARLAARDESSACLAMLSRISTNSETRPKEERAPVAVLKAMWPRIHWSPLCPSIFSGPRRPAVAGTKASLSCHALTVFPWR